MRDNFATLHYSVSGKGMGADYVADYGESHAEPGECGRSVDSVERWNMTGRLDPIILIR